MVVLADIAGIGEVAGDARGASDPALASADQSATAALAVSDDFPSMPAITDAELDVIERYFADLIDAALTAGSV